MLLGIGAHRSGSSWLYQTLKHHPDIFFPEIKEMHFFNSLDGKNEWVYKRFNNRLSKQLLMKPTAFREDLIDRLALHGDFDLYKQFYEKRLGGQKYFGEITPAYMALKHETLQLIAAHFADVKVVFFMRDPIQRLWSMIRFDNPEASQEELRNAAFTCFEKPSVAKRNNYRATIENYESVFERDQIYYGFYENLFFGESEFELAEFLNIAPFKVDKASKKNASRPSKIPPDVEKYFRENLADQYDFVRTRFGAKVPSTWAD